MVMGTGNSFSAVKLSRHVFQNCSEYYYYQSKTDKSHTEESAENGYTREKEERTTKNKMERRVPTRLEKYWTESVRGDGQGDVEKEYHQSKGIAKYCISLISALQCR